MRVLCFGDSNTYGYDPRSFFGDRYASEDRWVDLLAMRTGWEVINAGANGRAIPRALQDYPQCSNADLISILLGTNDLLQGASAQEAAHRMESFLTQLLSTGKQILLISPPPMKRGAWVPADDLVTESYRLAEEYKNLAHRLNIPFVDTSHWNIELTFDGVHFTEKGHHIFAEHLYQTLAERRQTDG